MPLRVRVCASLDSRVRQYYQRKIKSNRSVNKKLATGCRITYTHTQMPRYRTRPSFVRGEQRHHIYLVFSHYDPTFRLCKCNHSRFSYSFWLRRASLHSLLYHHHHPLFLFLWLLYVYSSYSSSSSSSEEEINTFAARPAGGRESRTEPSTCARRLQ